MEGFQSVNTCENDSIKFSCSEHILLHGASVYGSLEESAEYDVRIELWLCSESENVQLASNFQTINTTRTQHIYDVLLLSPVALTPGKQYKVSIEMKGPATKMGYGGKSDVMADGVNFHFMNIKGCKTTIEKGQMPEILFTQAENTQEIN